MTTRNSWDQCGRNGYYIGPALKHYWCLEVINTLMKAVCISDTVDFLHAYLMQTSLTPAQQIVHAVPLLTFVIKDVLATMCKFQLEAIKGIKRIFDTWRPTTSVALPPTIKPSQPEITLPATPNQQPALLSPTRQFSPLPDTISQFQWCTTIGRGVHQFQGCTAAGVWAPNVQGWKRGNHHQGCTQGDNVKGSVSYSPTTHYKTDVRPSSLSYRTRACSCGILHTVKNVVPASSGGDMHCK